jgi:NAD(P)-dependent dehydrogenase (short-subunit alcohol dehydrogenase family)
VAEQADVRDFEKLKAVVASGVSEFGRVDFVLANAGILPTIGEKGQETSAFVDAVAPAVTSPVSPCRSTPGIPSSSGVANAATLNVEGDHGVKGCPASARTDHSNGAAQGLDTVLQAEQT